MDIKVLIYFLVLVASVTKGEICTESVCEYNFEIYYAQTMTYYKEATPGPFGELTYLVALNDTDLQLTGNLLSSKMTKPEMIGKVVSPADVLTADGVIRDVITINGQLPGPAIEVMEGAEIVVHVTNHMYTDGVTLHWHGIHQYKTPFMDGTAGITQCPIPPTKTFTYRFKADPVGTHWYHTHMEFQILDGAYGLIVVHEAPPQVPEFHMFVGDWFHHTEGNSIGHTNPNSEIGFKGSGGQSTFNDPFMTMYYSLDMAGVSSLNYQSALINSRGRSAGFEGLPLERFLVTSGDKYRFRIVCSSAEYFFTLSIDKHLMTLVAMDGQEIEPISNLRSVIIAPGERFDIEVTADQSPDQYWFRAETTTHYQGLNGRPVAAPFGVKAVLAYDTHDDPKVDPSDMLEPCTSSQPCRIYGCPWGSFPQGENKVCISLGDAELATPMDDDLKEFDEEIFLNFEYSIGSSISARRFVAPRDTLLGREGSSIKERCNDADCTKGCACTNIYDIPLGRTVQMVLTNMSPVNPVNLPHSIHIHGYSMHILKVGFPAQNQTTGVKLGYTADIECIDPMCAAQRWVNEPTDLNLENPPLRDTFVVPAGGYVVARFKTYNPGYWLFHCHQLTHHAEGMSMVLNIGDGEHPSLPADFPTCPSFSFSSEQYKQYMDGMTGTPEPEPEDKITNGDDKYNKANGEDGESEDDGKHRVSTAEAIGICVGIGLGGIVIGIIVAVMFTKCGRNNGGHNL